MRFFKSTALKASKNLRAAFAAVAATGLLASCSPAPAPVHPDTEAPVTAVDLLAQAAPRYSTTTCHSAHAIATQGRMPQVGATFTRMAQQGITGANVIRTVTDPAQNVHVCISPLNSNDPTLVATYEAAGRRLLVRSGPVSAVTVAHEAFHAHQHLNNGFHGVASNQLLTPGDRTTGMLLIEATAAAYAQVVLFETQYSDPAYYRQHGRVNDYGMRQTFERAYSASYALNSSQDVQERRRIALQDAGQAVVRALMNGESREWAQLYRPAAQAYLTRPASHLTRDSADYQANRRSFYRQIGQVSARFQLVPFEYLTTDADAAIASQHRAFGLQAPVTVPRPPVA